jgi:tetratricopeptide (TPR) repeat protein
MQPEERLALYGKLILPVIVLVMISASPTSFAVQDSLRGAWKAQAAGLYQETADYLRQVLIREPWREGLWEQAGRAEMEAARLPQAVEAFTRAQAAGDLSPDGRFQLGEAYFLQKDALAAETVWKDLLLEEVDLPLQLASRVYDRLAQLQRARGDFNAAVETLRAWRAADPANPRVAYLLGMHLAVTRPEEGLPLLVESAVLDPAYRIPVQKLRRGINLAVESSDAGYSWLMIGRALGSAGEWDLAEEAFRQAVEAAPQYAEAWAFLGEARAQLGKDGQSALDQALMLDQNSAVVRALLALHYREQGNYDRALENLQTIAQIEPEEPIWEVELGNTWAEKGDLPVALEHFQKAVDLAPENSLYWQYLVRFLVEYNMDVRSQGLPAARQAVVLAPNDPGALDAMGWTMVYLADYASAERFLQQAVEKDASYTLALLHLGQLYLQEQMPDRAYSYLKRASILAGQDAIGQVAKRLLLHYYSEGG